MPYTPNPDLAAFIQGLPKTETHLHIEGAIPFELLQGSMPEKYAAPPASWADGYKFHSFQQFETELIERAIDWFTSAERYYEAAKLIFQRHVEQNVKYVETSFHAGIIEMTDIPGPEIVAAIRAAAPVELEVRVFMGMLRNQRNGRMAPVLRDCIFWEGLAGIDLHGTECLPLEDWARELWEAAQVEGKVTKAHAGEFGGPEYVREAIEELGVTQVQHGVRAIEDPAVVALAREMDVTLDICPVSNIKLDVFPDMKAHPIRQFVDQGVRCTVNTDDPLSFGNTLNEEYAALALELGFSRRELACLAANGFKNALMEEGQRAEYLRQLDELGAQFAGRGA